MSTLRFAAVLVAVLVLAVPSQASTRGSKLPAPANVHGFDFRPDEPVKHVFSRTPAFAWNPVRGAKRYEFVLSTSPLFAASGLVWDDPTLTTPEASVPLTLPWITGNPYSLFARVRAVAANGSTGPWSGRFEFNMRWATVPQQLPTAPGLVRWTPVEGATSYEVWYLNLDLGGGKSKIFATTTTIADEREYYTFHQTPAFYRTVLWRVRAVRRTQDTQGPANGLPTVSYGSWSPIYESTNPDFVQGPLQTLSTIAEGTAVSKHELMPAFTFSGNVGAYGIPQELYRVYVYTDADCLNLVFKGAIVGSPAYAPRSTGPLELPSNKVELDAARTKYLKDGDEKKTFTSDGLAIKTTEADPPSVFTPVLTAPPATAQPQPGSGSSGAPAAPAPAGPVDPKKPFPGSLTSAGAPIDLWDNDGDSGRYYWTVVPVNIVDDNGAYEYWDEQVAQDICVTRPAASFGKTSPAVVTSTSPAGGTPFVSGLSPTGKLVAAGAARPVFYGRPLVTWGPTFGASAYEIAWSKKPYPWTNEGNQYTFATSATLPLTAGTWYYRVRGIDLSLPTGAQQMAWSAPVALRIAKPKFKVGK